MTIPTLGALTEVDLREAWNHEAHSFTPWLAANLDALADKIGIPLELEGQEVPVETFAADILARNPLDDSLVLIENQLEGTDHTHLGQIMTYLAGLNAHTVVWVARDFREPHLSALKWLNDHTVEPFAFFAVKVKAVRIGDSPIAPVFEVMVRPNHWERQLQAIAQETRQMSDLGQFRKAFWTYYVECFPDEQERGPAGGRSWRSRKLPNGFAVVTYLASQEVGVFIRCPQNHSQQEIWDRLEPHTHRFEEMADGNFVSQTKGYVFVSSCQGDPHNRSEWVRLANWLHTTASAYEAALLEIFGEKS
jgi:hypothetical protein